MNRSEISKKQSVVLAAPVRTPSGKFGAAFANLTAVDLGVIVTEAVIQRAGIAPELVEELIFGNARQAGVRTNPARQISYRTNIPVTSPAYTVNQACASGLKSIVNAYQSILLGDADIVLAGGTESMSNTPYILMQARWGYRMGHNKLLDGMYQDGFQCPLTDLIMGETAENLVDLYNISRDEQDEYAVMSQQRCESAIKTGKFCDEIIPVMVATRKSDNTIIDSDESPRAGVTKESLGKLKPVFRSHGTVHAGNSSSIVDGAAAVLVLTEQKAKELDVEPIAKIIDYSVTGVDPKIMGIGPVSAVQKLLKRNNLELEDIDLIELNVAFAAQVLACHRELNFDLACLNVNGGAISLGHPIGCTGTRIVVTLLHEMKKRKAKRGLATLCVSGGMGIAILVENV